MEAKLNDMRQRMAFLLRAISNPSSLTTQDQLILQGMILEEARKQESVAMSAAMAAQAAAMTTNNDMAMTAVAIGRNAGINGGGHYYQQAPTAAAGRATNGQV